MSITGDRFHLTIEDNGVGVGETSGGGQGLALHSTLMAVAGGSLLLESMPNQMTRAELVMPFGAGAKV